MVIGVGVEWVSGNVLIRPNGADKGTVVLGHAHNFDHTMIVFTGAFSVRCISDGNMREQILRAPAPGYDGPSHLLIPAGDFHEIVALEDGSIFWCVYAHRTPQGDVVQEYNGWRSAYETTLGPRPEQQ